MLLQACVGYFRDTGLESCMHLWSNALNVFAPPSSGWSKYRTKLREASHQTPKGHHVLWIANHCNPSIILTEWIHLCTGKDRIGVQVLSRSPVIIFYCHTKSCFPMTRKGVHIVCIPRLRENVKCKFLQHLLPFIWKNMETVVASSHWAPDAWLWCLVWPTRAAKFDLHPNNLPELACGPWNYRYFIESDLAFLETCSSDCICQGGRRKVFVL